MTKTIQIIGDDFQVEVQTQSEITQVMINRMEKQMHAIVNAHSYHDIMGRITSINMTLYMLERLSPPNTRKQVDMLKTQIGDLSRMIEAVMS